MTITVPRGPLAAFRNRALKHYPREYGVLLYGRVCGETVSVRLFKNVGHINSTGHFWYDPDKAPPKIGRNVLLGLLHTHPDSDASPGDSDWMIAVSRQFLLHGICRVDPKETPKTKLAFYLGVGGMLRSKII